MISQEFGGVLACVTFIPTLENTGMLWCVAHERYEDTTPTDWDALIAPDSTGGD